MKEYHTSVSLSVNESFLEPTRTSYLRSSAKEDLLAAGKSAVFTLDKFYILIFDIYIRTSMPTLPASLFVKEPGKSRTLILEGENLRKEVQDLKLGEVLTLKKEKEKISLLTENKKLIGEISEKSLAGKIAFALDNQIEVRAVLVNVAKSGGKLLAQFIIKSSGAIFTNEKNPEVRPFLRGTRSEEAERPDEEKTPVETHSGEEEPLSEEETNPLSGLKVVENEKPSHTEEE